MEVKVAVEVVEAVGDTGDDIEVGAGVGERGDRPPLAELVREGGCMVVGIFLEREEDKALSGSRKSGQFLLVRMWPSIPHAPHCTCMLLLGRVAPSTSPFNIFSLSVLCLSRFFFNRRNCS